MQRMFLAVVSLLFVVACGGGGGGNNEAETNSTPPERSSPDAAVTEIVLRPVGDKMEYETTEFTVQAGSRVRVVMDNVATLAAMQHNVVITKPGTNTDEVGIAAIQAGEAGGYIPEHDAILFYTPMSKPGEKQYVEFVAPDPGDYPYVCTFPGHYALMKGVMHSVSE